MRKPRKKSSGGAHASRVLVSASRRNGLCLSLTRSAGEALKEVRDREDGLANTRDACAPQNSAVALSLRKYLEMSPLLWT